MFRWIVRSSTLVVCIAAMVGAGVGSRNAGAVVPNPCPKYECVQEHAYWLAPNTFVIAYYDGQANVAQGKLDVFTTSSTYEGNLMAYEKKYTIMYWDSCSPHCGKDNLGKWQSPQTVSTAGKSTDPKLTEFRQSCETSSPLGKQATNQDNDNSSGASPPGN